MASLNHVCMWSDHGWINVTAEEAAAMHPGGTVSSHSGLFMCDLCGQFVTFTDGSIRERYFKHSKHEADKSCPERTFGTSYSPSYSPSEHGLPIKLIISNLTSFRFELGFLYVPRFILDKQPTKKIEIKTESGQPFTYSFERLNEGTITYLPVGNEPSKIYNLSVSSALSAFWPQKVKGISETGSIFDAQTGKMLSVDADIQVQKTYFLLTTKFCYQRQDLKAAGVEIEKKCEQRFNWNTWRVYQIKATQLNETAAKFILQFHYRLTDTPTELYPIWPVYIKTPYVVKHNESEMIMHISGGRQLTPKCFPAASIVTVSCSSVNLGQVIRIACNERQQLISAGKANVLQYVYFWKERLGETLPEVAVSVKDGKGEPVEAGSQTALPANNELQISAPYDGFVLLLKNDILVGKIKLPANKRTVIDRLQFGITVQISQGLDVVWTCSFVREKIKRDTSSSDEVLYNKLISFKGNMIPVPHSLGSVVLKLPNYPKTTEWIAMIVRNGVAPIDAINYLKKTLLSGSDKRRERYGELYCAFE